MPLSKSPAYRWFVLAASLIVQMCLGVVYAWSVFQKPLIQQFGWTQSQANLAFSISLMSFAGFMIYAGRLQDRKGPRFVATIGGLLLGGGFLLASQTRELWHLYLAYGVLAGAGVGFAYVCPIATLVKWFPNNKGLISGLAVAGFGGGSLIFAPVAAGLIEQSGWQTAFWNLGLVFLTLVVLSAWLLTNPVSEQTKSTGSSQAQDLSMQPKDMVRVGAFKGLWAIFLFNAIAGLMVIGHLSSFGQQGGLDAVTAAQAVGVLAVFNALGRVLWGWAADRLGVQRALVALCLAQPVFLMVLGGANGAFWSLATVTAFIGFNFGGNFALFPAASANFFGTRHLGANYGLLFTAYGVAGLVGGQLGARVYDATQSYSMAFNIAAILCVSAAVIAAKLKQPELERTLDDDMDMAEAA